MEHTLRIRGVEERDRAFVLRVNEENVEVLSPMDEGRLQKFAASAEQFLVAEADGQPAAFLIAIQEGLDYDSENYRWFCARYERFLYIDRVVIDKPYRSLGLGRKLYQAVFDRARSTGVPFVTAEIDTVPYNETSLRFHAAMGFREVGVQTVRGGAVQVSLQEAAVGGSAPTVRGGTEIS